MNYDVEITDLRCRESVSEQRLRNLEKDVGEVKADVKSLAGRSGKIWDKIVIAAISAVATGLVATVMALMLR